MSNKKKEAGQKVWPFDTLPETLVQHVGYWFKDCIEVVEQTF